MKGGSRGKHVTSDISRHDEEIKENLLRWQKKPVLREIYKGFYRKISSYISPNIQGIIVELGSGIGSIKEVIPDCVCTDIFPNPWIDQVEDAYRLSFRDGEVSHIVLFDVFHHLQYPGTCLKELSRILCSKGRAIIFEPYISLLGLVVFGMFHHESVGLVRKIQWFAPPCWKSESSQYYAAQGNATRIFFRRKYDAYLSEWRMVARYKMSAFAYVASGGYSKPQLYPDSFFPAMKKIEHCMDLFPLLFGTRCLIVLERK